MSFHSDYNIDVCISIKLTPTHFAQDNPSKGEYINSVKGSAHPWLIDIQNSRRWEQQMGNEESVRWSGRRESASGTPEQRTG